MTESNYLRSLVKFNSDLCCLYILQTIIVEDIEYNFLSDLLRLKNK